VTVEAVTSAPSSAAVASAAAGGGAPPKCFRVASALYNATHQASAAELRPLWLWDAPERRWRFELMAGKGVVRQEGHNAHSSPRFTFAQGVARKHNLHFHTG